MGQIIVILAALMLAGCTTAPVGVADPQAVWCAHNEPRRPSADGLFGMSIDEKRDAVAHNRKGALWCGWQA